VAPVASGTPQCLLINGLFESQRWKMKHSSSMCSGVESTKMTLTPNTTNRSKNKSKDIIGSRDCDRKMSL